MYNTSKWILGVSLVSALLSQACKTTARLDAPAGFATLTSSDVYDTRSMSAHGVVIAARTEQNELRGNTEFWADSIDVRLEQAGYTREATTPFDARSGNGRMQHFSVQRDGRTMRYWVLVVAQPKHVLLVEAGGDKDAFDPIAKDVESAMTSVALK